MERTLDVTTKVTTTINLVSNRWAAAASLVLATVLFAASYTLTKLALVDLPPFTLGMVRFVLAGVILAAWAGVSRPAAPSRADRKRLLLGALLGVTGYFAFENVGLQWTTATDAALIVASYPALAALADRVLNGRRTGVAAWAGIVLAMCGVAIIVFVGTGSGGGGPLRLAGDLLLLVPGILWALYTFATRDVAASPHVTIAWQDGIGGLAFVPLALVEVPQWRWPTQPFVTAGAVVGLTLLCSIAAMVAYARALRGLPTATVVTGLNLVPLWGLLIAAAVLGERIDPLQLVGGLIVLCGVLLTAHVPQPILQESL